MCHNAGDIVKYARLGEYVMNKVPSLKYFTPKEIGSQEYNIESLVALSNSMRLLVRYRR